MPRISTLIGWAVFIILLMAFISNPAGFAHVLKHAGEAISTFVTNL